VSLDPAALVERALPARPPKNARVAVLSVGKAALAMARGALARWSADPVDALVVTVDGIDLAEADALPPRLTLLHAGYPVPDQRSVAAADRALALVRSLGDRDLCLALISDGASALLAAPPPSVTLADKCALVAELLDAGALISDVSLIRRHLSRVKGGRILAAAGASRVLTYILSDAVGAAAHDIGSGPTVFDPTTLDEARAALARWAPSRLKAIEPHLEESQKPAFPLRARWHFL
jgi:hydroxypyruvate reductase